MADEIEIALLRAFVRVTKALYPSREILMSVFLRWGFLAFAFGLVLGLLLAVLP